MENILALTSMATKIYCDITFLVRKWSSINWLAQTQPWSSKTSQE